MDQMSLNICKLCLCETNTNFEVLMELEAEMLETILIGINPSVSHDSVICCKCAEILQKCFDFKMSCLNSEESIKTFSEVNGLMRISLQDMCFKELSLSKKMREEQKICRLCFNWNSSYYANLEEEFEDKSIHDLLLSCLPEINLDLTYYPLVCHSCLDLLKIQYNFILDCMKLERQIKICPDSQADTKPSVIDLRNAQQLSETTTENKVEISTIKLENLTYLLEDVCVKNETNSQIKEEYLDVIDNMELKDEYKLEDEECRRKEQEMSISSRDKTEENMLEQVNCSSCSYTTSCVSDMMDHIMLHKNLQEFKHNSYNYKPILNSHRKQRISDYKNRKQQMYKCIKCPYKSKCKNKFDKHIIYDCKDPSELQIYTCINCSFETKRKEKLFRHIQHKHKNSSEVKLYKCTNCSFKSKWKSSLVQHIINKHKDPNEVEKYKCTNCFYETKRKGDLRKHILMHKDPNELQMYKCTKCLYEAKRKSYLFKHVQHHHKDSSEIQLYKCTYCSHKTKWNKNLVRHIQHKHKDPGELQLYKCADCSFETKLKHLLVRHIQHKHKDPSELQVYKCNNCLYETKWKTNLVQHIKGKHQNHRE